MVIFAKFQLMKKVRTFAAENNTKTAIEQCIFAFLQR